MASFKKIFISLIFIISFLSHFTAAGLIRRSNDCGSALKNFCKSLIEKGKIECACDEFELYLNGDCCNNSQLNTIRSLLTSLEKLDVCDKEEPADEYPDITTELKAACKKL
ncbi:7334_t:CDS:2 [Cetraspora pellucida]|uniref:7334_t:CDS:1 n=1 Tax=Cetraspora pellucida TaxID=1433469 RepID=A0A9N8ZLF9_9GLOM|nr:7334_t:CDS:2 [Cetraspora pellucida]